MSSLVVTFCKKQLQRKAVNLCLNILLILVASTSSYAMTIDELIAENKLSIKTDIRQDEQHIIGQPLVVAIEVATNRWFAKGTQIRRFELADTIVLANSEISINGTKTVDGQTWSTQTREITLYPRRHGNYTLPAITVQVSVNTASHGVVEGTIETKPQDFTITLPETLTNIEHFIVSPRVKLEVNSNYESNDEKNYAIGDAITQTITITAQDAPAMMIPPIQREEMAGLSIYQNTPQVFDKSNRGDLLGTRIESFTYILEQSGKYEIPEQVTFWWDTSSNELQEILIPALSFNVGHSAARRSTAISSLFSLKQAVWFIVIALIVVSAVLILYRYRSNLWVLYAKITRLEQRVAKKNFLQAVANHNYISAIDCLYRYSLLININLEKVKSPLILSLNKVAFDNRSQAITYTLQDAKELLSVLTKKEKANCSSLDTAKKIKLNN